MQRNGSTWVYFLSLILGVALTVALLPACGGGGGSSCNTPANAEAEDKTACEVEEVAEEIIEDRDETLEALRDETGGEESALHILEDEGDPDAETEAEFDRIELEHGLEEIDEAL